MSHWAPSCRCSIGNGPRVKKNCKRAIHLDKSDPVGHIAYGIHLACRGEQDAASGGSGARAGGGPCLSVPQFCFGLDLWRLPPLRRSYRSTFAGRRGWPPITGCRILGWAWPTRAKGSSPTRSRISPMRRQMKCGSLLHGQMGYCYAMAGRRDEAQREIGILKARSESHYVSPMSFAAIYAGLGEERRSAGLSGARRRGSRYFPSSASSEHGVRQPAQSSAVPGTCAAALACRRRNVAARRRLSMR